MADVYPGAVLKLLGPQTEPLIHPRILVFHTMVGYLKSTDALFRTNGYSGVESSFGVGGPWDGVGLDGAVWQWQFTDRQADAQAAGNAFCDSVETSDGGDPDRPWSQKQQKSLIDLTVWWCRQTGSPCRLVTSETDHGIGYHRQFADWNPNAHSCPGNVRLAQLKGVIIPSAARILKPTPSPTPAPKPIPVPLVQEEEMSTHVIRVTDLGYYVGWAGASDLYAKGIPGPYADALDEIADWGTSGKVLSMNAAQFRAMYTLVPATAAV